jgi:hypothetical protein
MNQHTQLPPIPFIDVAAQRRRLGKAIDEAIARVTGHCQFILGPEVRAFEDELARFCGARHVITCASGTDALMLALMAKGVGPGDAVFCPTFTFCATAEVAALVGATPIFVDVDPETFNIDAKGLAAALSTAKRLGLEPKAVIPVDLFGLPADHDAVAAVAAANGLFVLDDAAQAFGATYKGRALGTLGDAAATSFFPAKPLGCYGDGGAVFTDDDALAEAVLSLRVHGQGGDKYDNVRIGLASRLDTIRRPRRHGRRAESSGGSDFGMGAVHDQSFGRSPRRACRGPQGRRHSDGDLLPDPSAPPARLRALSGRRRRDRGERSPGRRSPQPADARLSRRGDPGSHHRRGTARASAVAARRRFFPPCRKI